MSISPEKIRSRQRTALWGSVGLLLLLTGIQLGLYLYGYDFSADLYLPGILPTTTALVWIAAVAGACLLALPLPGKTPCQELKIPSTRFTDYTTLLIAPALVSTVLLTLLTQNYNDPLKSLLSSTNLSDHTARIMLQLALISAVIAAIYYYIQFMTRKVYPLGVAAILFWCGCSALRVYFDMRYLLMSPRRVLHLMALIALLLFFVAELRLARGIATHRFYTMIAAPAMVVAGADAITNLILTAMGWINPGAELCTYFVLLAVSFYICARLCALASSPATNIDKDDAPDTDSPADENSPDAPLDEMDESPAKTEESPE